MPELPMIEPLSWFRQWYDDAHHASEPEPTAMALSTVDPQGQPTTRIVLLKAFNRKGFVFYTNLHSAKARHLKAHPKAGLCFWWKSLDRQIRIEGTAHQIDDGEADAYFASRARGSQIGAWASRQSDPLPDRATLIEGVQQMKARFEGKAVDRPPFWSGFRIVPQRFEFWQMGADRLHDRWQFVRRRDDWQWDRQRLYP